MGSSSMMVRALVESFLHMRPPGPPPPPPPYGPMLTDAELRALHWRTGRKVGRTIYAQLGAEPSDADILIGMMDTALLASAAVAAHNYWVDMFG